MTPPPLPPGTPPKTGGLDETPAAVDAGDGTRPDTDASSPQGPVAGPGTAGPAPIPAEDAPVWREIEESSRRKKTPVLRWRELLAVLLLVVVSDLTVYRGQGCAGYAALFLIAPGLLFLGSPFRRLGRGWWIVAAMTRATTRSSAKASGRCWRSGPFSSNDRPWKNPSTTGPLFNSPTGFSRSGSSPCVLHGSRISVPRNGPPPSTVSTSTSISGTDVTGWKPGLPDVTGWKPVLPHAWNMARTRS